MLNRFPLRLALCLTLIAANACSNSAWRSSTPKPSQSVGATLPSSPESSTRSAPATARTTASLPQTIPTVPGFDFCLDQRPPQLIGVLREALLSADGALLASVVDPLHGMDVQLLRNGTVVNYDQVHAAHLFESTYEVDWGLAPGSGLPVQGSFHELVAPALLEVLSKEYSLSCNVLRVGGATYTPVWPFAGTDFYSVYYAGTERYGGLDWRTWAVRTQYVDAKPFLRALTQLRWEP